MRVWTTEILADLVTYPAKRPAKEQVLNEKLKGGHGVEIDAHPTQCNLFRVQGLERIASDVVMQRDRCPTIIL